MAAALGAVQQARLARQGIKALSAAEGSHCLRRALRRPEAQLGLIQLELRALAQALGTWSLPCGVAGARTGAACRAQAQGNWAERLAKLSAEQRPKKCGRGADGRGQGAIAGSPRARCRWSGRSRSWGLDSLMAVELRNSLGQRVGRPLSATLVFDYPTVNALARWLLAGGAGAGTRAKPNSPAQGKPAREGRTHCNRRNGLPLSQAE